MHATAPTASVRTVACSDQAGKRLDRALRRDDAFEADPVIAGIARSPFGGISQALGGRAPDQYGLGVDDRVQSRKRARVPG